MAHDPGPKVSALILGLAFTQGTIFNTYAYVYRNDKLRPIYPVRYMMVPEICFIDKPLSTKSETTFRVDEIKESPIKPMIHKHLHFHRKVHEGHHDHHSGSIPAPFSMTKTTPRKYLKATKYPLLHSEARTEITHGVATLVKCLQHTHIHARANSLKELTPTLLAQELRHWHRDSEFLSDAAHREQCNPFPDQEMNHGWNRARCEGQMFFSEQPKFSHTLSGGPEIRLKLRESLSKFSLWRQLEPMVLEDDATELFDFVFVGGEEAGKSGCGGRWARTPGSWLGARRPLFGCCRGVTFLECMKEQRKDITKKVKLWEEAGTRPANGWKRRVSLFGRLTLNYDSPRKRVKLPRKQSEQVMSEKWRARRRAQEMKAGRWTDGTYLMDKMWDKFHWVLNFDNPGDTVWIASSCEVSGSNIWGALKIEV